MNEWRFWRRKKRNADLNEELAHDLALDIAERMRAGESREEAEAAGRRDFGNVLRVQEDVREAWGFTWLQQLGQDVRYGWRTLRGKPLFTAMAVLSLALGIGANTAIYSVMDAIMIRALPVRNPDELVIPNWRASQYPDLIYSNSGSSYDEPGGGTTSPDFPWPAYELFRDHNTIFSTLFAYKDAGRLNLTLHGQAEVGPVEFVSGNFFAGLGIVPAAGRLIAESDQRAGASQVAVLSFNFWRDRFAGDPAAVGQTVRINNIPFTITGVAAPEFYGVEPGTAPVIYVPITNRPALARNYDNERETMFLDPHFYWVDMMGRLRPGVTLAQAQLALAAPFHRFVAATAKDQDRRVLPDVWVEKGGSGVDSLRRHYSQPLLVLMTMVAFILVIACANIANLLLARASTRRREIAVRLSLGASRLRVLRQMLTESVMLALPGGLAGLAIAAAGIRFLLWLLAAGNEHFSLRAELNWRILGFTITVALGTGILFGLAPAIAAIGIDITPGLKETRASRPRKNGQRIGLGQVLIVSQVALSLLLVLGAAIFVRTLANLHSVQMGFNEESLLTFNLDASQAGLKDAPLKAFYAGMHERFGILPGVHAATFSDLPLIAGANHGTGILLPGRPAIHSRYGPNTCYMSVGPTFFSTMQIPILLGRPIDSHDLDGAPLAAVVNEVFAKLYLPNQNPVGQSFHFGGSADGVTLTIVGVAKDARYSSLKKEIPPVTYVSYFQNIVKTPPVGMTFELRTVQDPLALSQTIRQVVHEAAPAVPVTGIMTQRQRADNTISQERTFADLCTAFAVLALAIACIGLYATVAYSVSRRTNEIGIRLALGAERPRIVWMVLGEVLLLAAIGETIGLLTAWSGFSAIEAFVFGMKPADPTAILLAAGTLFAALLMAGYAPAVRASRIDPLAALRHE